MPRLLPLRAGLINPLCRSVVGGTFLRRVGELVSRKGPASMKGSRGTKKWSNRVKVTQQVRVGPGPAGPRLIHCPVQPAASHTPFCSKDRHTLGNSLLF